MTDTSMTETGPALAEAAAELLDRLRSEPLPAGERTAASLRQATRHAFILVEETRKLAAAKAPAPVRPKAKVQKNTVNRPFFLVSEEPEEDREDGAPIDFEAYRRRADRAYLEHPVGA